MFTDCINNALFRGAFPDSLKFAPVHKKDDTTDKENYRPATILPLFSKIFGEIIYDKLL